MRKLVLEPKSADRHMKLVIGKLASRKKAEAPRTWIHSKQTQTSPTGTQASTQTSAQTTQAETQTSAPSTHEETSQTEEETGSLLVNQLVNRYKHIIQAALLILQKKNFKIDKKRLVLKHPPNHPVIPVIENLASGFLKNNDVVSANVNITPREFERPFDEKQ